MRYLLEYPGRLDPTMAGLVSKLARPPIIGYIGPIGQLSLGIH